MKKLILLLPVLFLVLFLPSPARAQVVSNAFTCPNATLISGSCKSLGTTDLCANQLCHCGYQNTSLNCQFEQDQPCPGQNNTCPAPPLLSCDNGRKDCRGKTFNNTQYASDYIGCGGGSVCTGLDSNGCGFCQGFAKPVCQNNACVEQACDPRDTSATNKYCGISNDPCSANLIACTATACSFSSFAADSTTVTSGSPVHLTWGITGADNTKNCTWVLDNPGPDTTPNAGSYYFTANNTFGSAITKNYKLRCYNSAAVACDSPTVSVLINPTSSSGGTPTSTCTCTTNWSACSSTCNGTQTRYCDGSACTPADSLRSCNTDSYQCSTGSCRLSIISSDSSSATVIISPTPPVGTPNGSPGYNRTDWYFCQGSNCTPAFQGTNTYTNQTFTGLTPGNSYSFAAAAWSDSNTPPATTLCSTALHIAGSGGTVAPTTYQCWSPATCSPGSSGCDVGRWLTGDPGGRTPSYGYNFNFPDTSGYTLNNGCYRAGEPPPQVTYGTLGGKLWVVPSSTTISQLVGADPNSNAALFTQPADLGNVLYWVWSINSSGSPMCSDNNGTLCTLRYDNPFGYLSGANQLLGTVDSTSGGMGDGPLYSGNSVTLVNWNSLKYKPIGYYRYQGAVGSNCYDGPNGVECSQATCQAESTPEFFYWGGWVCDGCTGSPGIGPNYPVNNTYPNPDARYCMVTDQNGYLGSVLANARIDWVFQVLPSLNGLVYVDVDRSGTRNSGDYVYTSGATVSISGPTSTSQVTNSSGVFSVANVQDGSYTVTLNLPRGYEATTTNPVSYGTGSPGQVEFGIAPFAAITGKVCLDKDNSHNPGTNPGYPNITVIATGTSAGGTPYTSTVTSATGGYNFNRLNPGQYTISVSVPTNRNVTTTPYPLVFDLRNGGEVSGNLCISNITPWAQFSGAGIYTRGKLFESGGP